MVKTIQRLASRVKELDCERFYSSQIAKDNGIDESLTLPVFGIDRKLVKPTSFIVLMDHLWIAKFSPDERTNFYYTQIERHEHLSRNLEKIVSILYDWYTQPNDI